MIRKNLDKQIVIQVELNTEKVEEIFKRGKEQIF